MTQKLAYTFEEAAEQSAYSVRTLKQAVADGKLIARYVKTEGVIRHEDLATWIAQLPTKPDTAKSVGMGTVQNDAKAGVELPAPALITPVQGRDHQRPAQQAKVPQLPMPASESEWLTPEDLARMWQVAVGTINNWRGQKRGPDFVRIGGLVRYSPEAVKAWVEKHPTD
jgi:predicted DNA-binding transcriptional regulator AlpA